MKAFFVSVLAFVVAYWVSFVLVAIGIVQMFINRWLILAILVAVAVVIYLVTRFKK